MNELTGKRFGRWYVLCRNGSSKDKHALWLCICECGEKSNVNSRDLISGKSTKCKSCRAKENETHGKYNSKLYRIYHGMIDRCNREKSLSYKNYGGRGIKVCNEWLNDFICFYDWALNNGYSEGLEIDRIDNNGDYEPSNCRWVTRAEQTKNTRRNKFYTLNGETLTLTDWCRKLNINYDRTRTRLRLGWEFEKAIKEVN